ncbi:MAG: GWxTD domain-containing protein [Acidobacteria bacterium]|jgi:GWxTD domain-containing protein|nr:GWxTD domain-containing protein [Acidobacteriota bacterium]
MKIPVLTIILLSFLFLLPAVTTGATKSKEINPWQQWLDEVEPIMSKQERSTALLLKTLEERKRFQDLFWKARNPNPHDPENKYKIEYYRRLDYARRKLDGVNSDRGRIYILLGKPFRIESYAGEKNVVDCELWEYRTEGHHGLFPFMNFIFYKPRDMGNYQLYQPGIHNAAELLSPYISTHISNVNEAFHELKSSSGELAQASLSIVAGEGEEGMESLSSSAMALSKVYNLPEREAETGYIRTFTSPTGNVQVTHSTSEIRGYGYISITQNKNIKFLNYAVMPENLGMKYMADKQYGADTRIDINIEDEAGKLIYQDEQKVDVKVDPQQKKEIERRKIVFMNLVPIIDGDFNITIMFINKSTDEFFTYKEKISISPSKPAVTAGFAMRPVDAENFMPFASGDNLVIIDPRCTFTQKESLEGMVWASEAPEIFLESSTVKDQKFKIESIVKMGDYYKFSKPLTNIKDDNYRLIVTTKSGTSEPVLLLTRKLYILPFYMSLERPLTMAKPISPSLTTMNNYLFIQGQQFLNTGKVDQALDFFNKISQEYWNGVSIPVIARAYYLKKDYARVVELLERFNVPKVYATVIMLANSAIHLKMFDKAVQYLEKLRQYGDTLEVNHLLAAAYLSLGQQEKAKLYYDHAKELLKK